jgi:hypothetical protein
VLSVPKNTLGPKYEITSINGNIKAAIDNPRSAIFLK